jgi:hypothetical protein
MEGVRDVLLRLVNLTAINENCISVSQAACRLNYTGHRQYPDAWVSWFFYRWNGSCTYRVYRHALQSHNCFRLGI